MCDRLCVCPPSPKLEEQIIKAKQALVDGATPSQATRGTLLSARSLSLVLGRAKQTRAHTLVSPTRDFAPVKGSRKVIVLLVDFSDEVATTNQSHYNDLLFSVGTFGTGSMRDFYKEASYNKLDVTGTVSGTGGVTVGWYRAANPKSHYTAGNFGLNTSGPNAPKLVSEVITMANAHVNFAPFDNNGDGTVEAVVIIAAGSGAEQTGSTDDFWSHKWNIPTKTVDGVKITKYFMAPEDGLIGVMAHELGHLLMGWPDLYDTDYTSRGTGSWDLMAGGSWNNGGNTPAHPTAWCKAKVGWVNPTVIFNAQQNVTIKPYSDTPQVYKLPIGSTSSKEYFLVSNRQKKKFDNHLPGEGMIIEHCDDNQTNNSDENHYLVDIEQCDGLRHLNTNANSGDANDPFPCGGNNSLTDGTTPNSKAYSGADSKVLVTNIQKTGDDITATLKVGTVVSGPVWHTNTVTYTYAFHTTKSAWAFINTLGWRRLKDTTTDGVTNMFDSLCEALANGLTVYVYADDQFIYKVFF